MMLRILLLQALFCLGLASSSNAVEHDADHLTEEEVEFLQQQQRDRRARGGKKNDPIDFGADPIVPVNDTDPVIYQGKKGSAHFVPPPTHPGIPDLMPPKYYMKGTKSGGGGKRTKSGMMGAGKKGFDIPPPAFGPTSPPSRAADFECMMDGDCMNGEVCESGTCVLDGAVRFSLIWQGDDDLFLFVFTDANVTENVTFAEAVGGSAEDADIYVESASLPTGAAQPGDLFSIAVCQNEPGDLIDDFFSVKAIENGQPIAQFFGVFRADGSSTGIVDDTDGDGIEDDLCQLFIYQIQQG